MLVERYGSTVYGHPGEPDGPPTIAIKFQDGPVGDLGCNGCGVEDVIAVLLDQLDDLNRTLPCPENAHAVQALLAAVEWLARRTVLRQAQGVEGTNLPHYQTPSSA